MNITSQNIKNSIISKAKELGFEQIGFAGFEELEKESEKLNLWLEKGYDADMAWIKRGFEKRKDIRNILPDAKSVISLAYNYYTPFEHDDNKPKISRYAWGKDYHKVLKKKLKELCNIIEQTTPYPLLTKEGTQNFLLLDKGECPKDEGVLTKYYVDDGPVMDKAWAVKTGLGWQGKHSNVINPDFGSWFFICSIITNIEFDSYSTQVEDLCGSCTLCISACPTGAIADEYVVDSNKCISYHTIENRGGIPKDIDLSGWIFGCDVCQDVCPYNSPKYNRVTSEESFFPLPILSAVPASGVGAEGQTSPYPLLAKEGTKARLPHMKEQSGGGYGINVMLPDMRSMWSSKQQLEQITEEEFNTIFAESPIKRTKFKGWKRNLEAFKPPFLSPPDGGR